MAVVIPVEMGETRVSNRTSDHIRAIGLGACVGICLFDPIAGVGAMVHVVLPHIPVMPPTIQTKRPLPHLPGKCADTALPHVIGLLEQSGAVISRVRAAIVGGAQIFSQANSGSSIISRLEIGPRNVVAVKAALAKAKIPLVAENVGGHCGRTVTLEVSSGRVMVRPIGAEDRLLVSLADAYAFNRGKERVLNG